MHRAAANLKFGNAIRGAQDAARALEMFLPPVEQNKPQRLQSHLLRARSLRRLEMMTEALMDFTEAEKLDPNNENIKIGNLHTYVYIYIQFYMYRGAKSSRFYRNKRRWMERRMGN